MEMLYSLYSNPMDLIRLYIDRGRFGEFVTSVVEADRNRKREKAEKEEDWKLWTYYVQLASNGLTDENFHDWKQRVCKPTNNAPSKSDADLTEAGMKSILDKLFKG